MNIFAPISSIMTDHKHLVTVDPEESLSKVKEIFDDIEMLVKEEVKENNVEYSISIQPESLEINADTELIQQVLINLIKNAIHALENTKSPLLKIKAYYNKR